MRRGDISEYQLEKDYRAVYRNVYVPKQQPLSALTRARAAWLWSGGRATLTGLSAAAVLGTKWLDPESPAELIRVNRHVPPGIVVRSYELDRREVRVANGIRITTPERTAFDIGRTMPQDRAVPVLDALANATHFKILDVVALAESKPGIRGVRRLRAALRLVDGGAESPQESRLRLLLVRAGLPRRKLRSRSSTSTALPGSASTWAGVHGKWPSSMTACSTGRTGINGRGTSTASRCSKRSAGLSSESAPR
ncbi:hypothetical protein I552_7259 [Mycobacterium xenopi 3993]|nr:hypothetical protein I552_7259 [Mycobacterium xenopi 3993]